jgi:hypothetical protein
MWEYENTIYKIIKKSSSINNNNNNNNNNNKKEKRSCAQCSWKPRKKKLKPKRNLYSHEHGKKRT